MPILFVAGDLFANRFEVQALAHGCNCQGAMGAGIAAGFKERYPQMYVVYRQRCKTEPRQFNLGDVFFWQEEGRPAGYPGGDLAGPSQLRGHRDRPRGDEAPGG